MPEWVSRCADDVHNDAKGPHIHGEAVTLTLDKLGSRITRGANHKRTLLFGWLELSGAPEVSNNQLAIFCDVWHKNILKFYITMDYIPIVQAFYS